MSPMPVDGSIAVEDFKVINAELASFGSTALDEKPMIVIATKIDSANPEKLKKLATHAKRRKLEFHAISAVTGEGIDELKWALAKRLQSIAPKPISNEEPLGKPKFDDYEIEIGGDSEW